MAADSYATVVQSLAALDPIVEHYDHDGDRDDYCRFCDGPATSGHAAHSDGCVWARAAAVVAARPFDAPKGCRHPEQRHFDTLAAGLADPASVGLAITQCGDHWHLLPAGQV